MLAFKNHIQFDSKKPHIDDGDATENYGHDKYKISTKTDPVLDDIVQERPLSVAREQEIDAYEPKQEDKFKSKSINFKDFDDLLIGFEDGPLKSNPLADRDNTALFGKVSPEELMMSNLETQAGTSNKLNTLLRQKETGRSISDIKAEDAQIGQTYDDVYKNGLDTFMKEYNALQPTTDVDELKAREEGKTKTIKALKQMTEEQKTKAIIRSKQILPKKTVIRPVVPVEKPKLISQRKKGNPPLRLDVLQKPVQGFNDKTKINPLDETPVSKAKPDGRVSALIKQFDKLLLTPKSTPKSKPKGSHEKSTFSNPKLPPQISLTQRTPDEDDIFPGKYTVKVMKQMAKDQGIKGVSSMRKSELYDALEMMGKIRKELKSV